MIQLLHIILLTFFCTHLNLPFFFHLRSSASGVGGTKATRKAKELKTAPAAQPSATPPVNLYFIDEAVNKPMLKLVLAR